MMHGRRQVRLRRPWGFDLDARPRPHWRGRGLSGMVSSRVCSPSSPVHFWMNSACEL